MKNACESWRRPKDQAGDVLKTSEGLEAEAGRLRLLSDLHRILRELQSLTAKEKQKSSAGGLEISGAAKKNEKGKRKERR